jgi:hypothetical protein
VWLSFTLDVRGASLHVGPFENSMRGDLSIKVIRGNTRREGMHLVDSVPTAHAKVQAFATELCKTDPLSLDWSDRLKTNALASIIQQEFHAATTRFAPGSVYRSRPFSVEANPTSKDFEAPAAGTQRPGRYTEGDQRVLYLASTAALAALECDRTPDKPRISVQRFDLDLPDRRIVRVRLDPEARFPHLHYLMLDSEYLPTKGHEFANVQNPYRATHFLAYLCVAAGVSGLEYPSVRRSPLRAGSDVNLAIFGDAIGEAHAQMSGAPVEWK